MGRKASLTEGQKQQVREQAGKGLGPLSEEFGVSTTTIWRAINSKPETLSKKVVDQPYTELGATGTRRYNATDDYVLDWESLDRLVATVKRMRDHPIVAAVTFAVEMTVRSATWTIEPASEDQADKDAAEFLESCLEDMSHTVDDHLSQAITMAWYGFAPFEVVYKRRLGPDKDPESKYDDGLVGWRKWAYRSPDTLAFGQEWDIDENGGIQAMRQLAPPNYKLITIPIDKMLLYRTTAYKNSPQGRSVLRGAYAPWYYSKNLSEIEAISAERMGSGIPVIYMGRDTTKGASNSDFTKAQQLVRNVRVDEQAGIVIPFAKMGAGAKEGEGMIFELVSPPSRGIINFNETIERNNKQISQVLLAQFIYFGLTERGTQALAVRATDFFSMAIGGWLGSIADTINRYAVPKLFQLNGGKFGNISGFPELVFSPIAQIDVTKLSDAIQKATAAGALHPDEGVERVMRELLELPEVDPKVLEEQKRLAEEAKAKAAAEAQAKLDAQTNAAMQPASAEGKKPSPDVAATAEAPANAQPDVRPAVEKAARRFRLVERLNEQATRSWDWLVRGLRRD